jgi:dethiobiotin synthetase
LLSPEKNNRNKCDFTETTASNIMSTYFITGIDTDAGKSVVTGLLLKYLLTQNTKAITLKLTQTGCEGIAEDILTHREMSGTGILQEDREGKTCPYIFKFPASPHLSAELEQREISPEKIISAVADLNTDYETVLVEGAGGFMVPLTRKLLTADLVAEQGWPLILVSSGKLGSINHTLLTIEAAKNRNLHIAGVVYNNYPVGDPAITADSKSIIVDYLKRCGYPGVLVEAPLVKDLKNAPVVDFSALFAGGAGK